MFPVKFKSRWKEKLKKIWCVAIDLARITPTNMLPLALPVLSFTFIVAFAYG